MIKKFKKYWKKLPQIVRTTIFVSLVYFLVFHLWNEGGVHDRFSQGRLVGALLFWIFFPICIMVWKFREKQKNNNGSNTTIAKEVFMEYHWLYMLGDLRNIKRKA